MTRGPAKYLSLLGVGGLRVPFVWPSATKQHSQTPPPPMMRGPWEGRPGPLIMGVGVPQLTKCNDNWIGWVTGWQTEPLQAPPFPADTLQ